MELAGAHSDSTAQSAAATPVPLRIKLSYGMGAIAFGIKDNGYAVLLLFYYNQVVGLPATLVSAAIMLALFADALIDPLVGQFSDRTRTRWGQRHPWLYGSALPIATFWLLLWHPPEASDSVLFVYLVGVAMLVRFSCSAFEVPSLALLPELTRDYHERTIVLRYRYIFGWAGGLAFLVMAYGLFLVPEPGYPVGQLNANGYSRYAILGAVVMFGIIILSALGLHRTVVAAYNAENVHPETAESFAQVWQIVKFRPFMLLLLAGVFAFANQGLVFALTPYLLTHVWEFSTDQFTIYSLSLFAAATLAFFAVTPISRKLGKPRAAALLTTLSLSFGSAPYWLRLIDAFPANGAPALLPVLLLLISLSIACAISTMILTASMMADVTDASAVETGKRTEGLFSAGFFFMQKCVGGLGIFISGLVITFAGMPEAAAPGSVAPAIVGNFALSFAALVCTIGTIGALAYLLFPLGEKDHDERLALLKASQRK